MKRIILLVLTSTICTVASAQLHRGADDALDKHVLAITVEGPALAAMDLQRELNLSQEQYEQVMELNRKRFEQVYEAEQAYSNDAQLLSKTIYTINLETNKALSTMLDPMQQRLYMELEGNQQVQFISDNGEE
ncbi:hypothetical protein [uncultured Pontibacter sp.]|uniref:hypothetical protein n=1 Tax=uncultured Pontibacter sp. TaxID=453356 RepID=UPI00262A60B0|nr:hypothetical protein [uncultured Pontibacter sp.]